MQVKQILKTKGTILYTTTPDASLSEAVVTMADADMGSLVVMEGGKLVGLLTFREVVQVVAQRHKEQRKGPTRAVADLQVSDVMRREPFTTSPNMELNDLRQIMIDSHQRYLPVLEGETLLGVVSFLDVARAVLDEQGFENKMLKAYIRDWPAEA